jgi:tellurite resistance protein TerC
MYGGFMESIGNLWLYVAFFGIVIVMLLIDFLGFKQKQGQDVSIKQAAYWSVAWVSVAAYLVVVYGFTYNKQLG